MLELRLRNRISEVELEEKQGKIVTTADYNLLLTGDARLLTPEGDLLCVYRRGAVDAALTAASYPVLHELRTQVTDNRGLASGTQRLSRGDQKRTRTKPVASAIIGSFDPTIPKPYCRLTAWTGEEAERFASLRPFLQRVAAVFSESVPERYAVQAQRAAATDPTWVIPGTPYTTITVNNTYPTGVHTDKGDLDEGFSCLTVVRRGRYTGGELVFPRYRVAVDLQDGDVIMMNAHEWHGNTAITELNHGVAVRNRPAERISVVCYYRTDMLGCGTPEQEYRKAQRASDLRSGLVGQEPLFG